MKWHDSSQALKIFCMLSLCTLSKAFFFFSKSIKFIYLPHIRGYLRYLLSPLFTSYAGDLSLFPKYIPKYPIHNKGKTKTQTVNSYKIYAHRSWLQAMMNFLMYMAYWAQNSEVSSFLTNLLPILLFSHKNLTPHIHKCLALSCAAICQAGVCPACRKQKKKKKKRRTLSLHLFVLTSPMLYMSKKDHHEIQEISLHYKVSLSNVKASLTLL